MHFGAATESSPTSKSLARNTPFCTASSKRIVHSCGLVFLGAHFKSGKAEVRQQVIEAT